MTCWSTYHQLIGCIAEPDKMWPRVTVIPLNISMKIDTKYYQTYFFKPISSLSVGNCRRRWFMQWIWHSRVNHAGMDLSVSYPPSGLSPLWISLGRTCCISYYSLVCYLLIYYGYGEPRPLGTPPPSWTWRITKQWVGVHNQITPPPLWFVPWFTVFPMNFHDSS